jgi:hypothetical protein
MVLAGDGDHPYWYGRVVSIFHINIRYVGSRSRDTSQHRLDILWVRWYQLDASYPSGWQAKQLHGLHFIPSSSPDAFSFINPVTIIRAVHILPAFHYGTTEKYLPADSEARVYQSYEDGEYNVENEDYEYYHVNM